MNEVIVYAVFERGVGLTWIGIENVPANAVPRYAVPRTVWNAAVAVDGTDYVGLDYTLEESVLYGPGRCLGECCKPVED